MKQNLPSDSEFFRFRDFRAFDGLGVVAWSEVLQNMGNQRRPKIAAADRRACFGRRLVVRASSPELLSPELELSLASIMSMSTPICCSSGTATLAREVLVSNKKVLLCISRMRLPATHLRQARMPWPLAGSWC